jgi:hypothetical protein
MKDKVPPQESVDGVPSDRRASQNRYDSSTKINDGGFGTYIPKSKMHKGNGGSSHRKPWRILLIVVVLVALIFTGIFLILPEIISNADGTKGGPVEALVQIFSAWINPAKAKPVVTIFKASSQQVYQNDQVHYIVATNLAMDDVRLLDEAGNVIPAIVSVDNPPQNTLWTILVTMDTRFDGQLYPALKEGDIWYVSDKGKALAVLEPTPTPQPTPTPTPSLTPSPTPTPTSSPSPSPTPTPSTMLA